MKPTIALKYGQLRPVVESDLDQIVRLLHEKKVRQYLCDDQLLSRQTVASMLERSNDLDRDGLGMWVIESGPGTFAGIIALEPVSHEASAVPAMQGGIEPTIALRPDMWNLGLAREALHAAIAYALRSQRLKQLVAAVDEPNAASHRLMTACGFAEIGRSPGPAHELVLYKLDLEVRQTQQG